MRKVVLVVLALAIPCTVFAQMKAIISEVTGKVEIKVQGSDAWKAAKKGDAIDQGATISTGFKSLAVVKLGDTNLTVKALSRLTLKELVEKDSTVDTNLFLSVGKVKADVKPVSGKTQTFTVGSPVSTASVRGTAFDFDGVNLNVERGLVEVQDNNGFTAEVALGESASIDPESSGEAISDALDLFIEDSGVDLALFDVPEDIPAELAELLDDLASLLEELQDYAPETGTVIVNVQM